MNNRENAMLWWRHDLTEAEKMEFCNNYYSRDHHRNLTGREIERIWKNETTTNN